MKPLFLDRASDVPLYRQVAEAYREQIRSGALPPGTRLPATRVLVAELGVNRATAVAAYDLLEREGWVTSHVGRGTLVTAGVELLGVPHPAPPFRSSPALDALLGLDDDDPVTVPEGLPVLDFSRLAPDPSLFPVAALRSALDGLLARGGAELLQYGSGRGDAGLRDSIARRLARLGIPADADRVLVVAGAQQGIDLVLRAFAEPGDRVAVESPTYSGLLPLLRLGRLEPVPIPMTAAGLDLARLEARGTALRLLSTMPTLHNPTGITTGAAHRRELLALAGRLGFLVLEDGYVLDEEMVASGKVPPPLAAIDPDAPVIHLGSFSKGLFPGLRLGWIFASSSTIDRLATLKRAVDYGAPPLLQAAVDTLCRSGEYDAHLVRLREVYARRRAALARSLARHLPAATSRVPDGGLAAWVELPAGVSAESLAREAAAEGVLVTPASKFLPPGGARLEALRLSLTRIDEEAAERGVRLLGRLVARRARAAPRPAPSREPMPTL